MSHGSFSARVALAYIPRNLVAGTIKANIASKARSAMLKRLTSLAESSKACPVALSLLPKGSGTSVNKRYVE